jgi:hypothetical protein
MTDQVFRGRTEDAEAPFLNATFWDRGKTVRGIVDRSFTTDKGVCFVLHTSLPVEVNGNDEEYVSVGGMAGFKMALQAAGVVDLKIGDEVCIECTGQTPATKPGHSPRVNFEVEVRRSNGAF